MNKDLQETKSTEVAGSSPADMMRIAISGGTDLDKAEKFLILQEKWEANEAKKAYHKAMAEFKAHSPNIKKDKKNKQYNSMYTTIGNLVNTVNPELSKYGLSASWDHEQNGIIKVFCKITHKLGHSESVSLSAPADVSGSKNAIQQIKSTITYLKAVTFESICGLASSDANVDDDGSGVEEKISDKELHGIRDLLISLELKEAPLLKYLKIEKLEDMNKADYQKAKVAIEARKKVAK